MTSNHASKTPIPLPTYTDETVTGGQMNVIIYYDAPIFNKDYDLCDKSSQAGLDCPIKPRQYTLSTSLPIPSLFPAVSEAYLYLRLLCRTICSDDWLFSYYKGSSYPVKFCSGLSFSVISLPFLKFIHIPI